MDLPDKVAVMTISGATLFPQALLPLYIFEPRYRQMLADALRSERMFSVAMPKPGRARETPCDVAGLGLIRVSVNHRDGTSHLILQGITRVEVGELVQAKPYRIHAVRPLATQPKENVTVDALANKVLDLVRVRMDQGAAPFPLPTGKHLHVEPTKIDDPREKLSADEVIRYLDRLPSTDQMADLVACAMLPEPLHRQIILETVDLEQRLKHLVHFLMEEIKLCRKNKHK